MLITLVALLCNGNVCLEKVVTNSDLSSITMMDCQIHAQAGIAEWLQNGPYRSWKLQGYKCILGKYLPKSQAWAKPFLDLDPARLAANQGAGCGGGASR